jgi:hypothetical protein
MCWHILFYTLDETIYHIVYSVYNMINGLLNLI